MDNSYEIVDPSNSKNENSKVNHRARSNQLMTSSMSTQNFNRDSKSTYNSFHKTPKMATNHSSQNLKQNSSTAPNPNDFDLSKIVKKLEYEYISPPGFKKTQRSYEMKLIAMEHMHHNTDLITFSYIKKVYLFIIIIFLNSNSIVLNKIIIFNF